MALSNTSELLGVGGVLCDRSLSPHCVREVRALCCTSGGPGSFNLVVADVAVGALMCIMTGRRSAPAVVSAIVELDLMALLNILADAAVGDIYIQIHS